MIVQSIRNNMNQTTQALINSTFFNSTYDNYPDLTHTTDNSNNTDNDYAVPVIMLIAAVGAGAMFIGCSLLFIAVCSCINNQNHVDEDNMLDQAQGQEDEGEHIPLLPQTP